MKRLLIFFVIIATGMLTACSHSEGSANTGMQQPGANMPPGQVVFIKNCRLCHGTDGTLGLSGAANLSITVLSHDEIVQVVTNGRKGMPTWKGQLSPEQIQQVADYVLTLRK